jgi:hypothetical protein
MHRQQPRDIFTRISQPYLRALNPRGASDFTSVFISAYQKTGGRGLSAKQNDGVSDLDVALSVVDCIVREIAPLVLEATEIPDVAKLLAAVPPIERPSDVRAADKAISRASATLTRYRSYHESYRKISDGGAQDLIPETLEALNLVAEACEDIAHARSVNPDYRSLAKKAGRFAVEATKTIGRGVKAVAVPAFEKIREYSSSRLGLSKSSEFDTSGVATSLGQSLGLFVSIVSDDKDLVATINRLIKESLSI